MNLGIFGIPQRNQSGMYQSPWVPLEYYTTAKRYNVPHPYDRVPLTARQIYRCKKADQQFKPGMVWQECLHYQPGGNGLTLVLKPFVIEVCTGSTGPFAMRLASVNTNFTPAANSWEIALLVIK